jgi:ABC-type molybdate transport system substrate-binding protein
MNLWRCMMIGGFLGLSGCGRSQSQQKPQTRHLTVFAAASLAEPFTELGARYAATHPGVSFNFNFAGSNALRLQIEQHSPADVFASANQKEMKKLLDEGWVDSDSVHIFAGNRLALIVPAANPAKIASFADLARPGLNLIAADKAVPAGAYFEALLDEAARRPAYGPAFSTAVRANTSRRSHAAPVSISRGILRRLCFHRKARKSSPTTISSRPLSSEREIQSFPAQGKKRLATAGGIAPGIAADPSAARIDRPRRARPICAKSGSA